jgi:purine-cytosine permease-like protein
LKSAASSTVARITIQILKSIIAVFLLLALLFGPAGTLKWLEAWLYIIFYLIAVAGIILWMRKKSPELLKERMSTSSSALFLKTKPCMPSSLATKNMLIECTTS